MDESLEAAASLKVMIEKNAQASSLQFLQSQKLPNFANERLPHHRASVCNLAPAGRLSRWDAKLPKDLEPRPPNSNRSSGRAFLTGSRSLSPRPGGPATIAECLSDMRTPPSSPVLLPTRAPTPPQGSPQGLSKAHYLREACRRQAGSAEAPSSAPTTPTFARRTLDVPGRLSFFVSSCETDNEEDDDFEEDRTESETAGGFRGRSGAPHEPRRRVPSPSPTRTGNGASAPYLLVPGRPPRPFQEWGARSASKSPSRYLDNLSSRQLRGVSPLPVPSGGGVPFRSAGLVLAAQQASKDSDSVWQQQGSSRGAPRILLSPPGCLETQLPRREWTQSRPEMAPLHLRRLGKPIISIKLIGRLLRGLFVVHVPIASK